MRKKQNLALGKGAAALFGKGSSFTQETSPDIAGNMICMVDVKAISSNTSQPRKNFKEDELKELADSIRENGVLQPLIAMKSSKGFELIAGERRLMASKIAGLKKVPVILKRVTDKEKKVFAIIENVQRSDLNCVEEALAYSELIEEYDLTQEEVAKKMGKQRSGIANLLRILSLPREVITLLREESLSFGHGKLLAGRDDSKQIVKLAQIVVREKLSVRQLEALLKKEKKGSGEKKKEVDGKWERIREDLEKRTGFHFMINHKKNGSGQIVIKYSDKDQFNDIYDYFIKG
jgi:ParB family chromosome partitioning protein